MKTEEEIAIEDLVERSFRLFCGDTEGIRPTYFSRQDIYLHFLSTDLEFARRSTPEDELLLSPFMAEYAEEVAGKLKEGSLQKIIIEGRLDYYLDKACELESYLHRKK